MPTFDTPFSAPILHARDSDRVYWRFQVSLPLAGSPPPDVTIRVDGSDTARVGEMQAGQDFGSGFRCWRWLVEVPRRDTGFEVWYQFESGGEASDMGQTLLDTRFGPVSIPPRGELPRFAFFSCNGVSDPREIHQLGRDDRLWQELLERHDQGRYGLTSDDPSGIHLLIGAGDQIYCDSIWHSPGELHDLRRDIHQQVGTQAFERILGQYFQHYFLAWSTPALSTALSRIPCVFTWDDHEIVDGWGSLPPDVHQSRVYRAGFEAAALAFSAFQLGGAHIDRSDIPDSFFQRLEFKGGDRSLEVILPDLRSERTLTCIMSDEQWDTLKASLAASETSVALVVSSVPVVYRRTRFESIPAGSLEDDRRDQWEHRSRRGDRREFIHHLLKRASRAPTVVLAGDVHVGCRAVIEGGAGTEVEGASVHQVVSSPMVHPAPKAWQWWALCALSEDADERLPDGTLVRHRPLTRGIDYLRARNFVLGSFSDGELWIEWNYEDGDRVLPLNEQLVLPL